MTMLSGDDLRAELLNIVRDGGNSVAKMQAIGMLERLDQAAREAAKKRVGSMSRDALRGEILDVCAQLGRKPLI